MAPRLVSSEPRNAQEKKWGLKTAARGRARGAGGGGGGLPGEQTQCVDRDLFILDELAWRCGAEVVHLALSASGATLRATRSPPASPSLPPSPPPLGREFLPPGSRLPACRKLAPCG